MVKKHYYSWNDIEAMCSSITLQMYADNFRPDYIVGITRGGNVPATIISNMTGIPCEALKVSLRDNSKLESNCAMADDAFGIVPYNEQGTYKSRWDPDRRKKILIVDDINDTGATFNWIANDWQQSCQPNNDGWTRVWGNNVRIATLTDNMASETVLPISYTCHEVNKEEEDIWLVYPWEDVGEY